MGAVLIADKTVPEVRLSYPILGESSVRTEQTGRTSNIGMSFIMVLNGQSIFYSADEIKLLIYAKVQYWRDVIFEKTFEAVLQKLMAYDSRFPSVGLSKLTRESVKGCYLWFLVRGPRTRFESSSSLTPP